LTDPAHHGDREAVAERFVAGTVRAKRESRCFLNREAARGQIANGLLKVPLLAESPLARNQRVVVGEALKPFALAGRKAADGHAVDNGIYHPSIVARACAI